MAHTKEAQDSARNWEEEVRQLKEQADKYLAAQCEEVALLTTGQETLRGQLTEAAEERRIALAQADSMG